MPTRFRQLIYISLAILAVVIVIIVTARSAPDGIAILNPAGTIAAQQRDLMFIAFGLMLLVVIPVFVLTFFIAWKYRATNTKARYEPEWDSNRKLEALWWGLPMAIIAILAVLAWNTSHSLEPRRAIQSDKETFVVQVVALQWKWLFLYPEQQLATVNYVKFPAGRPVEFQITADAPMNSFWIPRLGGQIYAMSGMTTRLHLESDQPGIYHGASANISGEGFARMNFTAEANTEADFKEWVENAKTSQNRLGLATYTALSRPAVVDKAIEYSQYDADLYDTILAKYSGHGVHDAR